MTESPSRRHHLPKGRWLLLAAAIVVMGIVALRVTAPISYEATAVERRDIVETLAVVGRVRAYARAGLGVSVSGTVASIRVREGDRVAPGDLLLALDDREAVAQLRQAEATLSEVTAEATQELEEAERDALQTARELDRLRAVFEEGGLTRQRVEQAEQRAADAASRLSAARAQVGGEGEQEEAAAVARARAAVDAARAHLALFRVTAPAEGVVLSRNVEPGDAVSPGQIVLEISFDGPVELVVFPSEENLSRLSPGAPAMASADAYPKESFAARVSFIAPSVDPSQGTIEVRLTISEPPSYLLPDMTVSVNIETGRRTGAMVLIDEAVQGLGTSQPWVGIVQDGRLARRDVTVGLRAAQYVEVVSGLDVGEVVVRSASRDDLGRRVRLESGGG